MTSNRTQYKTLHNTYNIMKIYNVKNYVVSKSCMHCYCTISHTRGWVLVFCCLVWQ